MIRVLAGLFCAYVLGCVWFALGPLHSDLLSAIILMIVLPFLVPPLGIAILVILGGLLLGLLNL